MSSLLEENCAMYVDVNIFSTDDASANNLFETLSMGACAAEVARSTQGDAISNAFVKACQSNHSDIAHAFVENGINVNTRDIYSRTPLYAACNGGDIGIIKLLIQHHADLNTPINGGHTPLMAACSCNFEEVVRVLVEAGVDVRKCNNGRSAALTISCGQGKVPIVRCLLEAGGDVNAIIRGSHSFTPLIVATIQNHPDVVALLLEWNAEVNTQNENGETALILASKAGRESIVRILLEHNADVSIQNSANKTAAQLAATEVIKELILNHVSGLYTLK